MALHQILGRMDNLRVGSLENTYIMVWIEAPTLGAVSFTRSHFSDVIRRYPRKTNLLVVIQEQANLPDEECRKAMMQLVKEREADIQSVTVIQEATGFRGAAIRSVLTSFTLFLKTPYKVNTLPTVSEGALWLVKNEFTRSSAHDIEFAIQEIRAQK